MKGLRMSINTKAHGEGTNQPQHLYPAGIAFLIEERPLLWYEKPEEYDCLRSEIFAELSPEGTLECLFVKNLTDYVWELRRMKRLKQTAINFAMPVAAGKLLAPGITFHEDRRRGKLERQAQDVAYGTGEEVAGGEASLEDEMEEARVTNEMIHYQAFNDVTAPLDRITRECERLEGRLHKFLQDFEGRRATLSAMAKSLVEREKAETVEFRES
jgi:hypothetical protein